MIQKFQKVEQIFIPLCKKTTGTKNLKEFLKENFQILNNDLERICKFIGNDRELEKIIFELPSLIKNKIKYDKIQIKFFDEFQEDYIQLEVIIFTNMDIKTSLMIEDELENNLYELYGKDSADKLLLIME